MLEDDFSRFVVGHVLAEGPTSEAVVFVSAVPALRQPVLARHVTMQLVATFLSVYATGRRRLGHRLKGQDPDVLRAIIEEQSGGATRARRAG